MLSTTTTTRLRATPQYSALPARGRMPRHFLWPKPLKMQRSENHASRFPCRFWPWLANARRLPRTAHALVAGICSLGLTTIASAQVPPPGDGAETLSAAYPGKAYSPYAGRSFPSRPL